MGCDIHQYAEIRVNGQWVAENKDSYTNQNEPDEEPWYGMGESGNSNRNYFLFGILSEGVRYDHPPGIAFDPHGKPTEASPEVLAMIQQWEGDGHSHNYLTFQELKEKAATLLLMPSVEAKEALASLSSWITSFGELPNVNDNDRRVVFWFDN